MHLLLGLFSLLVPGYLDWNLRGGSVPNHQVQLQHHIAATSAQWDVASVKRNVQGRPVALHRKTRTAVLEHAITSRNSLSMAMIYTKGM